MKILRQTFALLACVALVALACIAQPAPRSKQRAPVVALVSSRSVSKIEQPARAVSAVTDRHTYTLKSVATLSPNPLPAGLIQPGHVPRE